MYKRQLILVICFLFSVTNGFTQAGINQSPSVIKSVLTHAGSSNVVFKYSDLTGKIKTTTVEQSIGQRGVIGLSNTSLSSVQQGYLNNVKLFEIDNTGPNFVETIDLSLSIYPNPFKDHVNIKFSKPTVYNIQIEIFDVRGRLVKSQEFQPAALITVPTNRLEDASYIIRVSSGSQEYLKKLIKGIN